MKAKNALDPKNAHARGSEVARQYFQQDFDPNNPVPKEQLLKKARTRAVYTYGAKNLKTISHYVDGWREVIEAREAEQEGEQV